MQEQAHVKALGAGDAPSMRQMLVLFGKAFDDRPTYTGNQPDDAYLTDLLTRDSFVAIAAFVGSALVGGLTAYVLPKFEQARAELYIYDLAVDEAHRRRGIATAIIAQLKRLAASRRIYMIFVQADYGDEAAIRCTPSWGDAKMSCTSTFSHPKGQRNRTSNGTRRFMAFRVRSHMQCTV
jgi:ribosomal protein S18 acetylase RimI-like enzyme